MNCSTKKITLNKDHFTSGLFLNELLTLFRMGLFGAVHGWRGGKGSKRRSKKEIQKIYGYSRSS